MSTPLPFLPGGRVELVGLNLLPNVQKGGLDRTSVFRGGLLKKRGVLFSGGGRGGRGEGGLQFLDKK